MRRLAGRRAPVILTALLSCVGPGPALGEGIDLDAIVRMSDAGVPSSIVLAQVRTAWQCRELTADETIRLSRAGVDPEVIRAMVECRDARPEGVPSGGGHLGRDEALALLRESEFLPRPRLIKLPVGRKIPVSMMIRTAMSADSMLGNELNSGYGCAGRLGHLRLSRADDDVFGTRVEYHRVDVTPEGLRHGELVRAPYLGHASHYVYHVYGDDALRILAMRDLGDGSREVRFLYGPRQLDAVSRCIFSDIDARRDDIATEARAVISRYDSGWRVARLELPGERQPWIVQAPAETLRMPQSGSDSSRASEPDAGDDASPPDWAWEPRSGLALRELLDRIESSGQQAFWPTAVGDETAYDVRASGPAASSRYRISETIERQERVDGEPWLRVRKTITRADGSQLSDERFLLRWTPEGLVRQERRGSPGSERVLVPWPLTLSVSWPAPVEDSTADCRVQAAGALTARGRRWPEALELGCTGVMETVEKPGDTRPSITVPLDAKTYLVPGSGTVAWRLMFGDNEQEAVLVSGARDTARSP